MDSLGHTHDIDTHTSRVNLLCRICGRRVQKAKESRSKARFNKVESKKRDILLVFNVDVSNDVAGSHPPYMCLSCTSYLSKPVTLKLLERCKNVVCNQSVFVPHDPQFDEHDCKLCRHFIHTSSVSGRRCDRRKVKTVSSTISHDEHYSDSITNQLSSPNYQAESPINLMHYSTPKSSSSSNAPLEHNITSPIGIDTSLSPEVTRNDSAFLPDEWITIDPSSYSFINQPSVCKRKKSVGIGMTPPPQKKIKSTAVSPISHLAHHTSPHKSKNAPLTAQEKLKLNNLLLRALKHQNHIKVNTGGRPIYLHRVRISSGKSKSTRHRISQQTSHLHSFITNSPYKTKPATKHDKHTPNLSSISGLAMKSNTGMTWHQQRQLRRYLANFGVKIPSERQQRRALESVVDKSGVVFKSLNTDDVDKPTAECVFVNNLSKLIIDYLEEYDKLGMLTNSQVPENEIWIKVGGDHGGDSFKLSFQIVNVSKPNSKTNTVMFFLGKFKDSRHNLGETFKLFKTELEELQCTHWRGRKFRLFLFGDYAFLSSIYGLSGATGIHPCLWCTIKSAEMNDASSKFAKRDVSMISRDYQKFQDCFHCDKKFARKCRNIVSKPLLDIPLDQVIVPFLHITLGVVKKNHELLEHICNKIDKKMAKLIVKKNIKLKNLTSEYKKFVKLCRNLGIYEEEKVELEEKLKSDISGQERDEALKLFEIVTAEVDRLKIRTKFRNYPSDSGPICQGIEHVLQTNNIKRQAYHGKSFIGNHCRKYITYKVQNQLAKVIKINIKMMQDQEFSESMKSKYSQFFQLNLIYNKIDSDLCAQVINENVIKSAGTNINKFMSLYRSFVGGSVYPKLHFLDHHCLEALSRWKIGLGVMGEQGGEQLHASINTLERQVRGIQQKEQRFKALLVAHLCITAPKVVAATPVPVAKRKLKL